MIANLPRPPIAVAMLLVAALVLGLHSPAASAEPKVRVDLVSEVGSVQPGVPFWVALRQRIVPGWHTYWRNPGDSGEPPTLEWTLPTGATAGEIAWPPPDRIPAGIAMSYGYSGEVLLPVRITPPADIHPGATFTLRAAASWLVCEKECIPEEATVTLALPVSAGPGARSSRGGPVLEQVLASLPRPSPWPVVAAVTPETVTLTVEAAGLQADRLAEAWFYPIEWGLIDHVAPQAVTISSSALTLRMPRGPLAEAARRPVAGVLVLTERLDGGLVRQAFSIQVSPGGAPLSWSGLGRAVALALAGGLLLNLMPCVLPVLSVKAISLVRHRGDSRAVMRRHGLAYTAGVLAGFGVVAAALLAFRGAGEQIGWGFQLQSPAFVALLAYLLFAMALVLSGALTVGGRLMGLGGGLASRPGYAGSVFTGALAVVVATPCSAPFMATALGYALTQPAAVAFAIFEALGLGLAAPYLALSMVPGWARLLPKPGPWMERLKQALAFPLYASVAWLIWVLARQAGSAGLAAGLAGLVLVALAAWLYEATRSRAGRHRLLVRSAALLSVGAAVALVPLIAWPGGAARTVGTGWDGGSGWEPYTPARLAELRAQGVPVFVNFTAAWCITCLVNERVALQGQAVREGFARERVVYLKADWTSRSPGITRALGSFERSGVPLYLLYPRGRGPGSDRPRVLPQLLTEGIVLEALRDL